MPGGRHAVLLALLLSACSSSRVATEPTQTASIAGSEAPDSTRAVVRPDDASRTEIDERSRCAVDTDCVLSTLVACCSHPLCAGDAAAVNRAWLAHVEEVCSLVECTTSGERPTCSNDGSAPTRAVCARGRCDAR